jgi:hypothetical protein
MTKRNVGVFAIFLLASTIAMGWGLALIQRTRGIILDYRLADFGARCLIHHCDLYNEPEMERFYLAHGGERTNSTPSAGETTKYLAGFQVYPPSAELFFAPFALFSWPVSYVSWIAISLVLVTIAAFLMWDVARVYTPDPPFYLACFLLVNSGGLLAGGNPAAAAVSLGVIGVWSVLQNRFPSVGVICIAVSLAIKPHDAGFVWLYLICLGATFRRRAVQSCVLMTLFAIAGVLWVRQVSPGWIQKLLSNLAALASNGSCNDPAGPAAISMVNLQTLLAFFRNDPRFYNSLSFAICAPLILVFLFTAIRLKRSPKGIWLGLATIAVLSLLPVYHRPHDAKILLLTLPACAMLCAEGGPTAWLALLFTGGGIVVTSELPLIFLQVFAVSPTSGIRARVLYLLTTRPAPLILFAESFFFLYVYVKHYRSAQEDDVSARPAGLLRSVR